MAQIQESVLEITKFAKSLSEKYFERKDEIRCIVLALCAQEHLALLGPAGVGKSDLIEDVSKALGLTYFRTLLCKDSKKDQVFGPLRITEIKKDRRVHNTSHRLPEAEIVFLDEVFKANSTILNGLLTAMNERMFENPVMQDIPLKTIFGASNELPDEETLNALWDRFMLRRWVKNIQKKRNRKALWKRKKSKIPAIHSLSYKHFENVYNHIDQIDDCDKVLESFDNICTTLCITSDRRSYKAYQIMKVSAILRGANKVGQKDLLVLKDIFWSTKAQITEVAAAIAANVGSKVRDAVAMVQQFLSELGIDPNLASNFDAASDQIKKLGKPDNTDLLATVRRNNKNIVAELEAMADEDEDVIEIYENFADLYKVFQNALKKAIGV